MHYGLVFTSSLWLSKEFSVVLSETETADCELKNSCIFVSSL